MTSLLELGNIDDSLTRFRKSYKEYLHIQKHGQENIVTTGISRRTQILEDQRLGLLGQRSMQHAE
jgi:hypothetical protein